MKRKRILNVLLIFIITVLLGLTTLEVSYRFQLFDSYKAELNGLNSKADLKSDKPKILIAGDSFTADLGSYAAVLRDSLPAYSVVNAAVPGTCIVQHELYMPKRIKKFKPTIFIYQFYVGNDLFDISHPTQSSHISFTRKAYWWVSDRLISLAFLNFRFAGFRYKFYDDAGGAYKPKEADLFSIETYSKREKLNYKAEPGLIENTLYLKNGREKDWKKFKTKFKKMVKSLKPEIKKYFIVIPHESQISQAYQDKHTQLGASFSHSLSQIKVYPLYHEMLTLCKELNFQFVDLKQALTDRAFDTPVYYANDPHLNRNGQVFLGNLLLNMIKANK